MMKHNSILLIILAVVILLMTSIFCKADMNTPQDSNDEIVEENESYIFLKRDSQAEEYIWIFEDGSFSYTYVNKRHIYTCRTGRISDAKLKNLYNELLRSEFLALNDTYFVDPDPTLMHELDQITLQFVTKKVHKTVVADTQKQPSLLNKIADMVHAIIQNEGDERKGMYAKMRFLTDSLSTNEGKISLGYYWEKKGRVFHRKETIGQFLTFPRYNYFVPINTKIYNNLQSYFDPKDEKPQILLKSDSNYYVIEIFKVKGGA